ncbi:MAG: D-cysteine desulfhydrase family protein [Desulfobacteraceae bacterium]|nr:MAG: D-cysteine desulfhydrase family protein [Desulfobacteraceae bacterium]
MENILKQRIELAYLPTPIHYYPRLSEQLGFELFVKRDDLTESTASGNKIRKMEYVLYEALQQGADTLVTCGGIQSNHCRAVAWTAAKMGLHCVLLLRGEQPEHPEGNLFFDYLLGAEARFYTVAQFKSISTLADKVCAELRAQGRKPFWIPMGASTATGSLGYVRMIKEIKEAGSPFDHIYCALGSGGTFAGILLGAQYYEWRAVTRGIAVCDDIAYFMAETDRIRREFREQYDLHLDLTGAAQSMDDRFVGRGYALNTEQEWRQLLFLARAEGLILDPVYTLKAFLGLIAHSRQGLVKKDQKVLFVHSGGHLGLLAKHAEVESILNQKE